MLNLFHTAGALCSRVVTRQYSTSFSSAIRMLHKDLRQPVFNIYGFVRLADEIVDSFHEFDKARLLQDFKKETFDAIGRGLSLNPVVHSFQRTVNEFNIDLQLVHAFFRSMEMDLQKSTYNESEYNEYIYGSAEVVGLMCLYVFCNGNKKLYQQLEAPARSLGAAFQKVNFLRDLNADYNGLARIYFPGCNFRNFTHADKLKIEQDIQQNFRDALKGILMLPVQARFGVYVAFKYYLSLFRKIKRLKPSRILERRIRIPDFF